MMTRDEMKPRYERMLAGTETIESHMHEHQLTHLNAEIAFQVRASFSAHLPVLAMREGVT